MVNPRDIGRQRRRRRRRRFPPSPAESNLLLQNWFSVASLPSTGVTGTALGLVDPVVTYNHWVKYRPSFICKFYLSVGARPVVQADSSLRYTRHVAGTISSQELTTRAPPPLPPLPPPTHTHAHQSQFINPSLFSLEGSHRTGSDIIW